MITDRHLLVDNRFVEDVWNVKREVVRPAKCLDNPLVVADRPWEDKGVGGCYVLFDQEEELFKVWYTVFRYLVWHNEDENWYTYWTCYAESQDGICWDKPELGICEYENSTDNNIVLQGQWWAVPGTIIKDKDEPDPNKLYKMLYTDVFGVSPEEGRSERWCVRRLAR